MRKIFLLLCLLPAIVIAQTKVEIATTKDGGQLAYLWDMDGEAADDDQIVASADLADSTTFTLAAQPDTCRLVDMTITDANSSITAGTVTVTGVDCLGYTRVGVFSFAVVATRGSGVKTIPVTVGPTGSSLYLSSVVSVVSSALTGEEGGGTDLIKVGYTSNSVYGWPMYGAAKTTAGGRHRVDPFDSFLVSLPVKSAAVGSNTLQCVVTSCGAFTDVSVGDILLFMVDGINYERTVTARASAHSITINGVGVTTTAQGIQFRFKKKYFSTDPFDEMYILLDDWGKLQYNFYVTANANTGGVVTLLECMPRKEASFPTGTWHQYDTQTIATGTTLASTIINIDAEVLQLHACRFGFKFGTGDDADAADESITLSYVVRK